MNLKSHCLMFALALIPVIVQPMAKSAMGDQGAFRGANGRKSSSEIYADYMMRAMKVIQKEYFRSTNRPEMVRSAIAGLYKAAKKPIPDMIAGRLTQIKNEETELRMIMAAAHQQLGQRLPAQSSRDLQHSMAAIFAKLEPLVKPDERSGYTRPEDVTAFIHGGPPQAPGLIGLILKVDEKSEMLRVVTPLRISPAYKAGIRGGDLIVKIRLNTDRDGKSLPKPVVYSTKGMSVARAYKLLRGRWGTRIKLYVIPGGMK